MNNKNMLIISVILFFLMLGTTIWASLQQNLFTEFSWTGSEVWFKATLIDFYINQFFIWLWVCYRERNFFHFIFWFILFFCFGSMGTAIYIMYSIYNNKLLGEKYDRSSNS